MVNKKLRLLLFLVFLAICGFANGDSSLSTNPQVNEAQLSANPKQQEVDYSKVIKTAFNKHVKYFMSEMYRRLTKDKDGYNDTYVLYDVQMYMQNAAIYADENGDKEILSKLLNLLLIPFEPQHMTDGHWLNNSYDIVGVEVDLCIAQYFSLLTRVLSASARHGIETNLSDENFRIIIRHLNKWIAQPVNRERVDDRHLFFVQSVVQFYDYAPNVIVNIKTWKQYVKAYMRESIAPKWEVAKQTYKGKVYDCWMLDRTGWLTYNSYSGYGSEITKTNSDTDSNSMFWSDGSVKQPKKGTKKVAVDISHARRFNWFFETIKRFGEPFGVVMHDIVLEGWANNLAFRVSRGTLNNPHFTIFSDGVDGWYRVGYYGRKHFGYTLGDMDIDFVASSYGIFGIYNSKIYDWMKAWVRKNKMELEKYHGGYELAYYTSLKINMKKPLYGMRTK